MENKGTGEKERGEWGEARGTEMIDEKHDTTTG